MPAWQIGHERESPFTKCNSVAKLLHPMDPVQLCKTVWICGTDAGQDVDICLETLSPDIDERSKGIKRTAAELKLHCDRLKECSKYFEVALSERWAHANATESKPGMVFTLDMMSGVEVEHYIDCFSRMYTPFRKDFKNVEFALGILRVASQIYCDELVCSICKYLATIAWSVEDESRIRQQASCDDFLWHHATDLAARLKLGGEECRHELREMIERIIRKALREYRLTVSVMNLTDARAICQALLSSIGHHKLNVAFERDMVMIVNKEVKEVLQDFVSVCQKNGSFEVVNQVTVDSFTRMVQITPRLKCKLEGICWVLDKMLKAEVADEVVKYLLSLELYPSILRQSCRNSDYEALAVKFARLILIVHQEATAGKLWLGTGEKFVLLRKWHSFIDDIVELHSDEFIKRMKITGRKSSTVAELQKVIANAREGVFLTLPIEQQTELVNRGVTAVFSPSSVVALLKKNWCA